MLIGILSTLLGLAVPLSLGLLSGARGLFSDPDAAVGTLNRYVLYVGFPALIVAGMLDRALRLPSGVGFYATVPVVAGLLVVALLVLRRTALRDQAGVVALTSLFANVAYVGLPVVQGVLGESALGMGALAVSIHVAISMLLGTFLLLVWGDRSESGALKRAAGQLVRQPLAWAPFVGLGLRLTPLAGELLPLIAPVGRSASPVALFLIGLFLHTHGRGLSVDGRALLRIAAKLVVVPLLTVLVVGVFSSLRAIDPEAATVLILLSTMPSAISTFAIAREFEHAVEEVTVTIVGTTVLCPLVIASAAILFE